MINNIIQRFSEHLVHVMIITNVPLTCWMLDLHLQYEAHSWQLPGKEAVIAILSGVCSMRHGLHLATQYCKPSTLQLTFRAETEPQHYWSLCYTIFMTKNTTARRVFTFLWEKRLNKTISSKRYNVEKIHQVNNFPLTFPPPTGQEEKRKIDSQHLVQCNSNTGRLIL